MPDKITHELMLKRNGENYKPDDNRTYIDTPLSSSPYLDVKNHISIPIGGQNGNALISTNQGNFIGISTSATAEKAENRVFFYPKASEFRDNVKSIERKKLPCLYPTWFIERYGIDKDFCYRQSTPIFYNVKKKHFFAVMDERFFDDFNQSEILSGNKNLKAKAYSGKGGKTYLGIYSKTIEDLESEFKDDDKTFAKLEARYKQHFINLQALERVIVVRYQTDNEESMESEHSNQFYAYSHNNKNTAFNYIFRQNMEFEIFQAARTEDGYYYLIDEKTDVIQPNAIIRINEKETSLDFQRSKKERHSLDRGGETFLIMPYSEKDWDMIMNIQKKMHQLCRELESFLQAAKTDVGALDSPISSNFSSALPLKLLTNE